MSNNSAPRDKPKASIMSISSAELMLMMPVLWLSLSATVVELMLMMPVLWLSRWWS